MKPLLVTHTGTHPYGVIFNTEKQSPTNQTKSKQTIANKDLGKEGGRNPSLHQEDDVFKVAMCAYRYVSVCVNEMSEFYKCYISVRAAVHTNTHALRHS